MEIFRSVFSQKKKEQLFFFWYGAMNPPEPMKKGSGVKRR